MEKFWLSIIIPCNNGARWLIAALRRSVEQNAPYISASGAICSRVLKPPLTSNGLALLLAHSHPTKHVTAIRKLLIPSLRLLVTTGLLWALSTRVDLSHVKEVVDHVSLPLLAAGAAALLATSPFAALRWHIVLAAGTTSPGPWTLLKIVLVGLFFNQVLPSGVGGDAVRAWRCHRLGIGVAAAIRSLVLDRVSGYVVMVVLFAAGLPVLLHILPDVRQRYGVVLLLGAALCGLLALFLIDYLPWGLLRFRLVAELAGLSREGRRLFGRPARLGALTGLSVATVGAYDRCLHASGGESRRRSFLLSLGRNHTPGHFDPAGTRVACRVGGARTRLCRRPRRVRNPGRGGARCLAVVRHVHDRRRFARRFAMAHRLGHRIADRCEQRTCCCPGRSIINNASINYSQTGPNQAF